MTGNLTPDELARLHGELVTAFTAGGDPDSHLDPETVLAYADGALDAIDREIADSHFADCMQCRREVRDLESFRASFQPRRRRTLFVAAAAAAVIAALLAIPAFRQGAAPEVRSSRPAAVTLMDGGRVIGLTHDGRITGLALDDATATRVVAALTHGTLVEPPHAAALRHATEALRGTGTASVIEPLAPIGAVVVTRQPKFEWTALPGARYKVEIFGDRFRTVAQSELLATNEWTVPAPLTRGETYAWQVTAIRPDGSTTTSPAPPAPEARFAVLDETQAASIAKLEAMQPRSHLALGVAYAEAGASRDAQQELAALVRENEGNAAAARLLSAVSSRH